MVTGGVFWDTNLFIYLIEERPADLSRLVVRGRERMIAGGDRLVTSSLTLGEVLVQPLRARRSDLAEEYEQHITSGATVVTFDGGAARRFAQIRATYPSVRPPDAVQLACAAQYGVETFVTNDDRLSRVKVAGVGSVLPLSEWAA